MIEPKYIKHLYIFAILGLNLLGLESFAATCNIKGGFKMHSIRSNGKLGSQVGNSRSGNYECKPTSRYYQQIKVNGTWRYVSTDATSKTVVSPSANKTAVNVNLTEKYTLNNNYVLRNDSGAVIASTFGSGIDKQSAQVFLDESGNPIKNKDGLIKIQLQTSGRSNPQTGWINPESIPSLKTIGQNGSTSEIISSSALESSLRPKQNPFIFNENLQSTSSVLINSSSELKDGDTIEILEGSLLIPKKHPSMIAADIKLDEPLGEETDLVATGRRQCDADNKRCYVEATFPLGKSTATGWFPENETSLNPDYRNAKRASEFSDSYIIESESSEPLSELADTEQDNTSDAIYNSRFTPEDKIRHEELAKAIEENKSLVYPQIKHETNRGLVRLNVNPGRAGYCNSYHYADETGTKAGSSNELETYAEPTTACLMGKLAEVWGKQHCPNGGACRLTSGDISHRTLKYFDGHRSHTNGQCIDFRPIRKSGTGALTYHDKSVYDQDKTREFLQLLKSMGGSNIIFHDPVLMKEGLASCVKYKKGKNKGKCNTSHDNHVHVCFKTSGDPKKPNRADAQCKSYKPDYGFCPELKSLFDNDLMTKFKK